ncbi:hypothetical protein Ae201684P_004971 [Aphanomyces euteiches]|nr:hypothetical protein Ae201684P_004971 [Aphanomyces euteiches]
MQPNEESQEAWTRYAEIHCVVDMTPTWQRIKTPTLSSHRVQLYRGIHHDKRVRSIRALIPRRESQVQHCILPRFDRRHDACKHAKHSIVHVNQVETRDHDAFQARQRRRLRREHVELANKRRGYVVAMNSVDEPSIPSSVDGISRARMRHSGVIAYETAIRGVIEVCYVLHLDFVQAASQTLCDRLMMQRILSLRHVAQWSKPAVIRWVSSILSL